jgi:hypothetical protein
LKHNGVKHLVERVMWRTGLHHEKKKRHEFAIDHDFRKYFKTRAEQVMKPINVCTSEVKKILLLVILVAF